MPRILFISYDGMTDPLGQSQVIPYLAGLTRFGYTFTILSCDKPDRYQKGKGEVEQLLAPYPIAWVSVPYHKQPPVLSSWYDYRQLKKAAIRIYRQQPFDMVHTRPGIPTLVALQLKRKLGVKFFNDIRGFWADERVDGGLWNRRNPLFNWIYRFFKQHETICLMEADANTCLTEAARKEIHTWQQIPHQPIPMEVIPCSADLALFNSNNIDKHQQEAFQRQFGFQDHHLVISYLGSIGSWYLSDDMMRFCKRLSDRIPQARFLFISPQEHGIIQHSAQQAGLDLSTLSIYAAKRKEVPVLLSLSTYSIFFIKPCYSKISSSPTKHGEIMAMGIPVITNKGVGDVAQIVDAYQSGFVLESLDAAAMDAVIDKIEAGATFDRSQIRTGAETVYALENAIQRYRKVYDAVFSKADQSLRPMA